MQIFWHKNSNNLYQIYAKFLSKMHTPVSFKIRLGQILPFLILRKPKNYFSSLRIIEYSSEVLIYMQVYGM